MGVTLELLRAPTAPGRASGGNAFQQFPQIAALPRELQANIASSLAPDQALRKRALDIVLTSIALLVFLPVLILIAGAILLESGWPLIHAQDRVGQGGRLFRMYKFRTMIRNAERRKARATIDFPDRRTAHKVRQDPRITRTGRFLRRTSLDELPQLLNVLRGDMSLVGPRPEQICLAVGYEPWQWERWSVPQGITGLWQIRGRSLRPLYLHTSDDIEYIRNYSLWSDIKILLKTVLPVATGRGAF